MTMRILIASNSLWSVFNFRSGLLDALLLNGCEIILVGSVDCGVPAIYRDRVKVLPINIKPKGVNPIFDILLFFSFVRMFINERPGCILLYTIKPVIYGSLAARLVGIRVISVITGLGLAFLKQGLLNSIAEFLYCISQKKVSHVLFLNKENLNYFLFKKLVCDSAAIYLPGEGVNPCYFTSQRDFSIVRDKFVFLFIGRMLSYKGINEFISAAVQIKKNNKNVEFHMIGALDKLDPTGITRATIDNWVNSQIVHYHEPVADVRPFIDHADCVVLPSYTEGLPRVLLEAAAMQCPVVASDIAGIRDVVVDGLTGFLCRPMDSDDLKEKLEKMLNLPNESRVEMGRNARRRVKTSFSDQIVSDIYLNLIFSDYDVNNS